MAKLARKDRRMYGMAISYSERSYAEETKNNRQDVLRANAPFLNTTWSYGRFEGNWTRLGDG